MPNLIAVLTLLAGLASASVAPLEARFKAAAQFLESRRAAKLETEDFEGAAVVVRQLSRSWCGEGVACLELEYERRFGRKGASAGSQVDLHWTIVIDSAGKLREHRKATWVEDKDGRIGGYVLYPSAQDQAEELASELLAYWAAGPLD